MLGPLNLPNWITRFERLGIVARQSHSTVQNCSMSALQRPKKTDSIVLCFTMSTWFWRMTGEIWNHRNHVVLNSTDNILVPLFDKLCSDQVQRCLYACAVDHPRHYSVGIDKYDYKLPYWKIFGGITQFTTRQFKQINGFSNEFWGWGGEGFEGCNLFV